MDAKEFSNRAMACAERLWRISYLTLQNPADCDDAVQEALLRAWANRRRLRDERLFETWLVRILINCARDMLRKRRPVVELDENCEPKPLLADNWSTEGKTWTFQLRSGVVFHNGAPLHDGAVVVSNFRICAAGCYLPLSQNPDISKDLGTRHRAAIGMSEVSDAVVLCVSEETGIISLAIGGQITRRYNYQSLNKKLTEVLITKDVLKRIRKKGNSAEKQSEEENG